MRHGIEEKPGWATDEWWNGPDCWPVFSTYYDDLYREEVSKDGKKLVGHGEATGLKKHHLFRPSRTGHPSNYGYRYDDEMLCNNCGKSYGHIRRARK